VDEVVLPENPMPAAKDFQTKDRDNTIELLSVLIRYKKHWDNSNAFFVYSSNSNSTLFTI